MQQQQQQPLAAGAGRCVYCATDARLTNAKAKYTALMPLASTTESTTYVHRLLRVVGYGSGLAALVSIQVVEYYYGQVLQLRRPGRI